MSVARRRSNDPRRKHSAWAVSFKGADGKRKIRYCRTKEEAEALYNKWKTDVKTGNYVSPVKVPTFVKLCDKFAEIRRAHVRDGHMRSHVAEDELGCMELYLRPYFGHRRLNELTLDDIEHFRTRLATDVPAIIAEGRAKRYETVYGGKAENWLARQAGKPIGSRTIAKALAILTMMLMEAQARGWVSQNVASRVRKRRPTLQALDPSHVLTEAEVTKLIDRATGQLRLMILTALRTGLRQGELLALTWGDVDLQRRRLHVRRSVRDGKPTPLKTRHSARIIPMDDELLRQLRAWRLAAPKGDLDLVFPADLGGYYSPSVLVKRFQAVRGGCGFERPELATFRWHDLRHCFVSHALAASLPMFEVSRLAGHSSPTVTGTIYSHFLPDREDSVRTTLSTLYTAKNVSTR
jgi:integrase